MTNEERDLIARYVARVGGAPQASGFLQASVPQSQPNLPPIDREADAFIAQQFQQYPEARYRITQTALVTEAALSEAQNQIQRLQWELEQAHQAMRQTAQQQPPAPPQQESKGFFGNMFGGGAQAQPQRPANPWGQPAQQGYAPQPGYAPQQGYPQGFQPSSAPPQPQYAPGYQPGMFQRGGSGFLGSALTTAAGVAGGMVVGNALMGAFSGNHGSNSNNASFGNNTAGGGGGGGMDSPWAGNAADTSGNPFESAGQIPTDDPTAGFGNPDPYAGGGAVKDASWDQSGGGFDDNSGFDSGGGGGFDDNT